MVIPTQQILCDQLRYVKNNIPFYMKKEYRDVKQIENFPIITKTMIKTNYKEFISEQFSHIRSELANFLRRPKEQQRVSSNEFVFSKSIIVEQTSGTSGIPTLFAKTIRERSNIALSIWKRRRMIDHHISPKNFFTFIHLPPHVKPIYDCSDFTKKNLTELYQYITRDSFRWLRGSPALFRKHIKVLKENNIKIHFNDLAVIESTGQYLSKEQKEEISDHFKVLVLDSYGLMESWMIALTCRHGYFHVNNENVYIEIIDEEGNVINEPNKVGMIIVTTLIHKLFPLIRYSTGDYGCFGEKRCDCKLGKTVIDIEEGREVYQIKGLQQGRVFGNVIFKMVFGKLMRMGVSQHLKYAQVVQTDLSEFTLYANRLYNHKKFLRLFEQWSEYFLGKRITVKHIILDESEIKSKNRCKESLFICRC